MKIIFNPKTIIEHLDELDRQTEKVYATRKIHYFFIPVLTATVTFFICSFTGKILIPILSALAFVILFPQILFIFLPSCRYPRVPTPKIFCCDAMVDGEIIEISVKTKLIGGILSILVETKNGELEERRLKIKTKKMKTLTEDIMDFESVIYFYRGKEKDGEFVVTVEMGEENKEEVVETEKENEEENETEN